MKQELKELLLNNIGKVTGVLVGVFFGILYLLVGFFKTIIFIIVVGIGFIIGSRIDNNEGIVDLVERLIPNRWK